MSVLPEIERNINYLPDPNDWQSIRSWRRTQREVLIRARIGIGKQQRQHCLKIIEAGISEILPTLSTGIVGFYWPIKGEFDLRRLLEKTIHQGWHAALPVVVEAGEPLEFRLWQADTKLVPGIWNIPVPEARNVVRPTVLLVPLVGFDSGNYRLGYGGGYYDRTIASYEKQPVTLGVGLDLCRLDTIYPQWHDIPMDHIVTVATQA